MISIEYASREEFHHLRAEI